MVIYYANYEYISTELCENLDKPELDCQGRCYLEKLEIKLQPVTEDKPIKAIPFSVNDYPISTVDFELSKITISFYFKKLTLPNYFKHFVISDFSYSHFQPPEYTA